MNEREDKLLLFALLLNCGIKHTSVEFWRIWGNDEKTVTKAQNDLNSEIRKLGQELWPSSSSGGPDDQIPRTR